MFKLSAENIDPIVKRLVGQMNQGGNSQSLTQANFIIASVFPKMGAQDWYGTINGALVTVPASTPMANPSGIVTNGTWNIFAFYTDAAGNMTSAMGQAGSTLASVVLPAKDDLRALIGMMVIHPTGSGRYFGGTTLLDDVTVVPNAVFLNTSGGSIGAAVAPVLAAAPTIRVASSMTTTGMVLFTPNSDNGSPITSYIATASPGGLTGTITGANPSVILVPGLTLGQAYTFTVQAINAAGTSLASAASNSVTPAATRLLNVSTGFVPQNTYSTAAKQSYSRTPCIANEDLTALAPLFSNWIVPTSGTGGFTEFSAGGTETYTASIEYPAGTITQCLFSGVAAGVCTANANLQADMTTLAVMIPKGAKYWVRSWLSTTAFIPYSIQYLSEGTAQYASGTTTSDLTMGGNAALVNTNQMSVMRCPVMVLANSTLPSVAIAASDSIGMGFNDVVPAASAPACQGFIGRAFGAKVGFYNCSVSSSTAAQFVSSGAKRSALIAAFCTHVVIEGGINDIGGGGGATNVTNARNSAMGLIGVKPYALTTITTRTSSTDGWTTTANQTLSTFDPTELTYNNSLKAAIPPLASVMIDARLYCEASPGSGLFSVVGGANTVDGLHCNGLGNANVAPQINTATLIGF